MIQSPPASDPDSPLVLRIAAGDESALRELMEIHHDYVRVWLSRKIGRLFTHEDAEEIALQTFLAAWRSFRRFEGRCLVKTWLVRVATNGALNRIQRNLTRRHDQTLSLDKPIGEEGLITLADFLPDESSLLDCVALSERETYLHASMETLDPMHREVLRLRCVENRTYDEIAAILQINGGTVKSRIARARASLRAKVEQLAA